MLFNSSAFFAFFPVAVAGYFFLSQGARVYWLLLMSCLFYMWLIPNYIFILLATVLVDYTGGRLIEKSFGGLRKFYLIVSVVFTCLILFLFKYYNFVHVNVSAMASLLGWNYSLSLLKLALPVGLSFHTFQSLSYVFEVYYGRQKTEKNFPIYFLYVMFFPQLVAGPIERPQNLLHQFREHHAFELKRIVSGLQLIAFGLFKKVVIADRLALLVNPVFKSYISAPAPLLVLAVIFFAFQIYCDFSGYTTIARGTARVLGFELMENFSRPYVAASMTDFWRRWHISLSTWFRDYLYIPLGGNRLGKWRGHINLLLTFLVSGLWHGANWTYVFWGGLNGLVMVVERLTQVQVDSQSPFLILRRVYTFSIVCLSWVLFRSDTLADAGQFLLHIFHNPWTGVDKFLFWHDVSWFNFLLGVGALVGLWTFEAVVADPDQYIHRNAVAAILAICVLIFGMFSQDQFIYFQF